MTSGSYSECSLNDMRARRRSTDILRKKNDSYRASERRRPSRIPVYGCAVFAASIGKIMNDEANNPGEHSGGAERGRTYRVLIDKALYTFQHPLVTGRDLLAKAGKSPVEQYAIYIKEPGATPKRVGLDERVDLAAPGLERFVTLPLDQTEGLGTNRRQFALAAEDMQCLDSLGLPYELVVDGNSMRLIVYGYPVPPGYTADTAALSLRVEPGYPDVQLDMVWFEPALRTSAGNGIGGLSDEAFDGRTWQRWSRHRTPANPWRPGVDCLATHLAQIEVWLRREIQLSA